MVVEGELVEGAEPSELCRGVGPVQQLDEQRERLARGDLRLVLLHLGELGKQLGGGRLRLDGGRLEQRDERLDCPVRDEEREALGHLREAAEQLEALLLHAERDGARDGALAAKLRREHLDHEMKRVRLDHWALVRLEGCELGERARRLSEQLVQSGHPVGDLGAVLAFGFPTVLQVLARALEEGQEHRDRALGRRLVLDRRSHVAVGAHVAQRARGVREQRKGMRAPFVQLRASEGLHDERQRARLQQVGPVLGGHGQVGDGAHALGLELRLHGLLSERHERLDAVTVEQQPLVVRRHEQVGDRSGAQPSHRAADASISRGDAQVRHERRHGHHVDGLDHIILRTMPDERAERRGGLEVALGHTRPVHHLRRCRTQQRVQQLMAAFVLEQRAELGVEREVGDRAHHEQLHLGRSRVAALDERAQPPCVTNLALTLRIARQAADRARRMPLRVGVARAREAHDRRDGAARTRELELHFRQCREGAEGRRGMPHGVNEV